MMVRFIVFCLLVAASTAVQWYQQQDLSEFHLNSLYDRNCFHGTYGSLTLFTCPLQRVYIEPFAELSSGSRLCVVETRDHSQAAMIAFGDNQAQVLFDDKSQYLILTGRQESSTEVFPSICSRSSFKGTAGNVYFVSETPFKPSVFTEKYTATAPDPRIVAFLGDVNKNALLKLINDLSYGNDTTRNPTTWQTRNSYSAGSDVNSPKGSGSDATKAVNYIRDSFATSGADQVQIKPWRSDMCGNVVAIFGGGVRAHEIVVFGSHADSRYNNNTDPYGAAPGGDDNGSGSSISLLFAQILGQRIKSGAINLSRTIHIQTYCGEEQGLLGSAALSNEYNAAPKANVIGMINVDMVGYRPPGTVTQFFFMNGSVNVNFTNYGKSVAQEYTDSLNKTTVANTGACCSDQQSWNRYYPSLSLFESLTNSYPDYHRQTDTPDKCDMDQVTVVGKLAMAITLSLALA